MSSSEIKWTLSLHCRWSCAQHVAVQCMADVLCLRVSFQHTMLSEGHMQLEHPARYTYTAECTLLLLLRSRSL